MADLKISQLTAATIPAGTDQFAINQGGTTKSVTNTLLLGAIPGNVTLGSTAADCGIISMIKGAQAGDPSFSITMATNTSGDVTLASTGDMNLTPTGGDVVVTGDVTISGLAQTNGLVYSVADKLTADTAALTSTYIPVATTNGRLTNSVLVQDATNGIDYTSGNVTYLPAGLTAAQINTYITNATAGDTLILGTSYTTTEPINVTKALTIRGQCKTFAAGNGTVINQGTASQGVFVITASNVNIEDMSVFHTSTSATPIYANGTSAAIVNVNIRNCYVSHIATDGVYSIYYADASGNIENCEVVTTCSNEYARGIFLAGAASTSSAATLNVINTKSTCSAGGSGATSIAFGVSTTTAGAVCTMNLYNCYGTVIETAGSTCYALECALASGGSVPVMNAYNCRFNGADFDASNTAGTLTLSNCTLAGNTVLGTITYDGQVVTNNIGIGGAGVGTSGTKVISQITGVLPTTSITDGYQMVSQDLLGAAGAATPHVRVETGDVVPLGMNLVNDAKGKMINAVYGIVTPGNVVLFNIFDRTGAVTALKAYETIGGTTAHTTALSANASTLTPAISGMAPNLSLGGTPKYTVTDAADLTFGNGLVDSAFSVVTLVNPTDATTLYLVAKRTVPNQEEWEFYSSAADKLTFSCSSLDGSKTIGRLYNTAITADQGGWHTYIATKSASVISTACGIYRDGIKVDDTTAEAGTYVAMNNGTAAVGNILSGTVCAGTGKYSVVIIVKEELTAVQSARLDAILRTFAGSDLN